jgi:hypothetical protein
MNASSNSQRRLQKQLTATCPKYINTLSCDFVCEEKSIGCSHNAQVTAVHDLQFRVLCES